MNMAKTTPKAALLALAVSGTIAMTPTASAGPDDYIGEVILVGYTFCPRNTVEANGQLLAISQNSALFSLYGTFFGGDGRTTFGVPDLQGRVPIGVGNGPGLSPRTMGQKGGAEQRTLTAAQMPSHNHLVNVNNKDGDKPGPAGKLLAAAPPGGTGSETIYSDQPADRTMAPEMISNTGGGQSVSTQDPFLVMRYCVVSQGIYPSRN